ncbi:MAG: hypothetical protein JXE06_01655 [Coriobacteriia bacterium]|nr:hypothetical protein [Coriobacteriia bacterium]MBN2822708.1 hypothetical protein [Coriobacteriia bacterium]
MTSSGGVLLSAVSLSAGWIGLWPVRRRLGMWGYHLFAYPVGLLLWPVCAAVLSLFGAAFQPLAPLLGLVVGLFAISWWLGRHGQGASGARVPAWSFLVWGGAVIGVSAAVAAAGITSAAYDSLFHYESWGVWIFETGSFSREVIGLYGAFIPSVHAAGRFFGADWTATPYPVLSLHVAAAVFISVRDWASARIGKRPALAVSLFGVTLMVSTAPYLHHTLYVHSHMISAAYLLLALYAVQQAYLGSEDSGDRLDGASGSAWLLVAGLVSAGFALTRTDGIAYAVVPLATASLLRLERDVPACVHTVLLGAAAVPLAVVYGSAFLTLGRWSSDKLSGNAAAAVLLFLALAGGVSLVAERTPKVGPWLRGNSRALLLVVLVQSLGIAGLVALRPTGFLAAGSNMLGNLFQAGGYGFLWFFALGIMAVSFVWGGQWRDGRWPTYLAYAIGQFFVVAFLVHGVGHPGRLSPADSFARVAFHAVPLVFWYAALVMTALAGTYRARK